MTTCATCKHWKQPDPPDPDYDAEIDPPPSPYGICKIAESSDGRPVVPLAPARAMDSSGYHASLGTLPTFGCVLHAPAAVIE